MRQIVFYSAVLIGAYLALAYATGGGRLIAATGDAASKYARTLQGR